FLWIAGGFTGGFALLILVSFAYFFSADRRIVRSFKPGFIEFEENLDGNKSSDFTDRGFELPVRIYFNSRFRLKQARPVNHYSEAFLDIIFKRHHVAAMLTVFLAFIFLLIIGFFLDQRLFQVPAAASVLILFAILVSVMGALSYFLRSWSLIFIILLFTGLNILYQYNIIDPRNKAYGLDYSNKERPDYSLQHLKTLNLPETIEADKKNMITILNKWKAKQGE